MLNGERGSAAPGVLGAWEGRSPEAWAHRLSVATVEVHARLGSTSDRARAVAAEQGRRPFVVVADRQSAGRGRRGRHWESDTPLGLWFTVAVDAAAGGVSVLPLRVGLKVALGLESVVPGLRVEIKWPNDLMAGGGKLGGVLCERAGRAVLAGVGLNLNHAREELPFGLETPATSVLVAGGLRVSRARVLARVFDVLSEVWVRPRDSIPCAELAELEARSAVRDRRLAIDGVVGGSSGRPLAVRGLAVTGGSIRPDGTLAVWGDDGRRLRVIAGSIRTRPTMSRT